MDGNQMKMREALLVVNDALDTISAHEEDIEFVRAWIAQTKDAVQEALADPPRQCDVGTAEEQERRFRQYCVTEECNRYRCGHGCKAVCIDRCAVAWSQMPYEAEEGDRDA